MRVFSLHPKPAEYSHSRVNHENGEIPPLSPEMGNHASGKSGFILICIVGFANFKRFEKNNVGMRVDRAPRQIRQEESK